METTASPARSRLPQRSQLPQPHGRGARSIFAELGGFRNDPQPTIFSFVAVRSPKTRRHSPSKTRRRCLSDFSKMIATVSQSRANHEVGIFLSSIRQRPREGLLT